MATTGQTNGMRGVYLVASELARLGLITSPTSRSARGADILATTPDCNRTYSVEVKTTTGNKFWQLQEHAKATMAESHIYVFVRIQKATKKREEIINYYPVTARLVARKAQLPDPSKPSHKQYRKGYSIHLRDIEKFQGEWSAFIGRNAKVRTLRTRVS